MSIIDVHCHLTSDDFDTDLPHVLDRALSASVEGMICMGETPADNLKVLELSRQHERVFPAFGHYPKYLDMECVLETEALARLYSDELVAIGEVGIDHWIAKEKAERDLQHQIFSRFILLGLELDLPVSVHSRSAGHHALRLLKENGARRVCMHAFDGKASYAKQGAEAGYYFSIPPSIVRSVQKQKMVKALDLGSLLLESDAPVLGPDPTVRNEPSNIPVAAAAIAEIKGVTIAEVLAQCRENTAALFGEL